ncbi:hypothetical protein SAMD00019534_054970 [Acytostelium subglobosum LB1]|uniref:hypothetical protein n=1 Tax=Acytostelium subglobosum LB1 TaxID=1410327 RepID=UPI000644B35F|nr:hypothetical protein SAMD00019534_054970 [Acytostelium subglobosum LB1]GAM22322.1 hypothetical protein SAMD00019534_054970 [Acytostelium subglobosum LB1]|eukprot:XP_012754442.1 hypothetical protein SAMD00019534_054970 [Acytostelium subglobosum LB1]
MTDKKDSASVTTAVRDPSVFNYNFDREIITDQDSISKELNSFEDKLSNLFDYYIKPSSASKDQIAAGKITIKGVEHTLSTQLQKFINDLSSLLDLDQITTFIFINSYSTNVRSLVYERTDLFDLFEYYYRDRYLLLSLVSSLIKKANDPNSLYNEVATKCVEQNRQGWETKLLANIQQLATFQIPEYLRDHPQLHQAYKEHVLQEQQLLMEIVFLLYYTKQRISFPKDFKQVFTRFQQINLGSYSDILMRSESLHPTLRHIEYISVLTCLFAIGDLSKGKFKDLSETDKMDVLNMLKMFETNSMSHASATIIYSVLLHIHGETLGPEFKEILSKCLRYDPFNYVQQVIDCKYLTGSFSAFGYVETIQLFISRFTMVYDLESTNIQSVDTLFDIYVKANKLYRPTLQDLISHDLFKYAMSEKVLIQHFEKVSNLLCASIDDQESADYL